MEEEFQDDNHHQRIQANGKNLDFRYFTVTPNLNKSKIVTKPTRKSLKQKVVIKDRNELANKNIIFKQTTKLNRKKDTPDTEGKEKEIKGKSNNETSKSIVNSQPKKIVRSKEDDKVRKITEFFKTLNKKAFKG